MFMRTRLLFAVIFFLLLISLSLPASAQERLRLSTTTSTENTGLLKALLPPFEKSHKVKVDVIAVGTGQSLKLGERGDVDLVFVHARDLEDKFVAEGYGVNRRDVLYNDFIIVGPEFDPAKIKGFKQAAAAFKRIAESKSLFISRGDKSGTHVKEIALWKAAGIKPSGTWYIESGKGMGEVLNMAHEKQAYTLTDRGTYQSYREKTNLSVLLEGDSILFNPYGIIAVNPAKHPHVQYGLAMALIEWVTSKEGQEIIRNFKDPRGNPLFIPNAK